MRTYIPSRAVTASLFAGALVALAFGLAGPARATQAHQHEHRSEYADQEASDVAALSAEEMRQLLEGDGMGLARAAELNSYPGPKHVLELAVELDIDAEQLAAVTAVRERMLEAAIELGARIVEAERAFDRRFEHAHVDPTVVREATLEIGRMAGELRAIHLVAHLETRALLSADQIARYDALRGYSEPR